MLEDGEGRLVEVLNEGDGGFDVLQIIVGQLLAMKLLKVFL